MDDGEKTENERKEEEKDDISFSRGRGKDRRGWGKRGRGKKMSFRFSFPRPFRTGKSLFFSFTVVFFKDFWVGKGEKSSLSFFVDLEETLDYELMRESELALMQPMDSNSSFSLPSFLHVALLRMVLLRPQALVLFAPAPAQECWHQGGPLGEVPLMDGH